MATGPILQLIIPSVDTNPAPAWFVQYASGYVQWAQNPTVSLCTRLGIQGETVVMGADQYNRYLAMATAGWKDELGAVPGVPKPSAASKSAPHAPDQAVQDEHFAAFKKE